MNLTARTESAGDLERVRHTHAPGADVRNRDSLGYRREGHGLQRQGSKW